MSDKSISDNGKNTALGEAARWADELMEAETKSRREKEYVVRDRLARKIGITPSYLFRLQYKLGEMTDVKGSVYRAIRNAYDGLCERVEASASAMELKRQGIEATDETFKGSAPAGEGMAGAPKGAEQELK